jgi:polysaccharide deacetylase family protein (PEP-CTERM system associated)
MSYHILLTIDVEDWFQVENFKQCIPFSSWPNCELRVEANTHRLLDLLDSIKLAESSKLKAQSKEGNHCSTDLTKHRQPNQPYRACKGDKVQKDTMGFFPAAGGLDFLPFMQKGRNKKKSSKSSKSCLTTSSPKATFFILGWLAERLPHLVREIHQRGHEVASHGYYHKLCSQEPVDDLKKDLSDSKKQLEDIIGGPVFGYRAPSFCVNYNILRIIEDCGYVYDSSYNSFSMHSRYSRLALSQNGRKGIAFQIQSAIGNRQSAIIYELPISNLQMGKLILPWGGGGYFRLIPLPLFRMGVQSILNREKAYVFYMHPWEIDQEQPRVENAPRFVKFRHYANLDKTLSKISSFIEALNHCTFTTCHRYLEQVMKGNTPKL